MKKGRSINKRISKSNKLSFNWKLFLILLVIITLVVVVIFVVKNKSGVSLSPGQTCPYGYTRADFLCYRWLDSKDKYYINSTDVDVLIYPKNINQPAIFCAKGQACNLIDSLAIEVVTSDGKVKCINKGIIPSGSVSGIDDTENFVWNEDTKSCQVIADKRNTALSDFGDWYVSDPLFSNPRQVCRNIDSNPRSLTCTINSDYNAVRIFSHNVNYKHAIPFGKKITFKYAWSDDDIYGSQSTYHDDLFIFLSNVHTSFYYPYPPKLYFQILLKEGNEPQSMVADVGIYSPSYPNIVTLSNPALGYNLWNQFPTIVTSAPGVTPRFPRDYVAPTFPTNYDIIEIQNNRDKYKVTIMDKNGIVKNTFDVPISITSGESTDMYFSLRHGSISGDFVSAKFWNFGIMDAVVEDIIPISACPSGFTEVASSTTGKSEYSELNCIGGEYVLTKYSPYVTIAPPYRSNGVNVCKSTLGTYEPIIKSYKTSVGCKPYATPIEPIESYHKIVAKN